MTGVDPMDSVVERVGRLLHARIGLRADPSLRGRLVRCVRDDFAAQGRDLDTYLETLMAGGEALQGLLNRITVQETMFFRHPEHFDVVAREVLPMLQPTVTIWSAGCANGQEAFSLAMLLDELDIGGSVIATDLSTEALQRTRSARYTARELTGLSPNRIARHLTRSGQTWQVNETIRARVSTLQHNLLDPVPLQVRGCQIIFCRNVLIYFSAEHAAALLGRFADALPTSWLFLGAAESVWQLSERFETIASGDTFAYRGRAHVAEHPNRSNGTHAELSRRPRGAAAPVARPRPGNHTPAPVEQTGSAAAAALPRGGRIRFPKRELAASGADISLPTRWAEAAQRASAAGDIPGAVVAFRKCVYLTPEDPMARLHLGLALENAGDEPAARRSYSAARQLLSLADPAKIALAAEGYTAADLHRLLDAKLHSVTR